MSNLELGFDRQKYPQLSKVKEKCGVFGVYSFDGNYPNIGETTYWGMMGVQHRGQEAAGAVFVDKNEFIVRRGRGLIRNAIDYDDFLNINGRSSLGHTRYSTYGGDRPEFVQPVIFPNSELALGHNGNLPYVNKLQAFLESVGINTDRLNDSGMMHQALDFYRRKGMPLEEAIITCYELFNGSFSALVMDRDKLVAVRDHNGFRPLAMKDIGGAVAFASESGALGMFPEGGEIEDVKPGEMVIASRDGIKRIQIAEPNLRFCSFELFYFGRGDSVFEGKGVQQGREMSGRILAEESPAEADLIVPILGTALSAAIGYAQVNGGRLVTAIALNEWVGRTFITPGKGERMGKVALKLNPMANILKGQRVVVVDDSLIRSTTADWYMQRLIDIGVKEAHLRIASPTIIQGINTGIDIPDSSQLIAAHKSVREIGEKLGATSLNFLSIDGLVRAFGIPRENLDLTCHTGGRVLNPERSTAKMLVAV